MYAARSAPRPALRAVTRSARLMRHRALLQIGRINTDDRSKTFDCNMCEIAKWKQDAFNRFYTKIEIIM